MYRVLCDGKVLHDIRDPGYQVLSPKISVELNKTGNLDFGMLSTHPHVNDINKLKSKIEVYEDDELLFSGRSLTNEQDFQNTGQISCEGELAFLLDSVQRAHDYGTETTEIGKADTNISIFKRLIEEHNAQVEESKRFTIGVIDIDSVTITKLSTNYEKTWDFLSSNFLGKYDGYLRVRHENGIRYLDYVKQYGKVSNQVIRFGENLLDLKKYSKAEDIKTAIIPLGAVVDNKNVDIKAANGHDGTDYVYNQEAVNLYGWIYDKVDFSDIYDPDTLLEEEYDKETQSKFLNVIASEARRMAKLVTDLLTLSRYDNNNVKIEKLEFDLGDLVKRCEEKLELEISKKHHNVECFVTANVPPVHADKYGIERVILNILTNSIKYTQDGGEIKIYVGFVYNDAYIKIFDNGIGIPEEDLSRIFERFYRVDKARTREMGGTGLGLSIAKEILDKNGGSIDIKSKVGEGTEVVIRIPTKQ